MQDKAPDKKDCLLAALEKGMVMVHLDARRPGVMVPDELREEMHLRLNVSYRFDPPDLSIGEWGVRCTLSFGGRRFKVGVPWNALFAVTSHATREFWMYPDDMPLELLQQASEAAPPPTPVGAEAAKTAPAAALAPESRPRPVLREVACEGKDEPPEEPPKPRRGHLRVVK